MCIGVGAALGAMVSIASSVVSFMAAEEEYQAKAEQWRQNYSNSVTAAAVEQDQLTLRTMQEQEAFHQQMHETNVEGAEVAAQAEVSAASAGVSGISLDNILNGIGSKISAKREADRTNHFNVVAQITEQKKGTVVEAKNRINSMQKPTPPNPLGYILQGVGGALKGFA